MTKAFGLKFGYDIIMEKGPCPRPVALKAWPETAKFKSQDVQPFKYMADVLLGLSALRLNPQLSCPVLKKDHSTALADEAWQALDPHSELWKRAQTRSVALSHQVPRLDAQSALQFEKTFNSILDDCFTTDGIDFNGLHKLIECIDELEEKKFGFLLYNFGICLSETMTHKLHYLYSMLFHLRSVVAVDWNAHIDDPSHEAVKVDSITDYVPKADYIVNDALLYWQFLKLSHPFTAGRNSDVKVEKLFVEPLKTSFHKASHNACHLIENLPKNFLDRLGASNIEQGLYLVQMDWLLGSHAGLLFKIREELYGLNDGYEKIFWHDLQNLSPQKACHLSLCFEVNESQWTSRKSA
jgi:hypothetical protein